MGTRVCEFCGREYAFHANGDSPVCCGRGECVRSQRDRDREKARLKKRRQREAARVKTAEAEGLTPADVAWIMRSMRRQITRMRAE